MRKQRPRRGTDLNMRRYDGNGGWYYDDEVADGLVDLLHPRRTWEELTPEEQSAYDWVDLMEDEGETMHDWWEMYMDAEEEHGGRW